jgi:hypothetical protein
MSSEKDTLRGDFLSDDDTANDSSADVNVSVLLGNGYGSFQAAVSFEVGFFTESVAVVDLDSDSFPDLVTANEFTNDVSVLINLPEPSARLSFLAGVGLLGLLRRRQKGKRRCSI